MQNAAKKITETAPALSMTPPEGLTDRQINRRMSEIADLDAQIKALQDRRDALKAEVCRALGDAETRTTGKYDIRYKSITSNRLDSKALKAEHPRIYAEFCRPQVSRRFEYKVIAG